MTTHSLSDVLKELAAQLEKAGRGGMVKAAARLAEKLQTLPDVEISALGSDPAAARKNADPAAREARRAAKKAARQADPAARGERRAAKKAARQAERQAARQEKQTARQDRIAAREARRAARGR